MSHGSTLHAILRVGDDDKYKPLKSCATAFYTKNFRDKTDSDPDVRAQSEIKLRLSIVHGLSPQVLGDQS